MTVHADAELEQAVTAAEIADMLSCSLDSIYAGAAAGRIPGFRIGREWRFFPSVVKAHLSRPADRWAQSSRSRGRKRK